MRGRLHIVHLQQETKDCADLKVVERNFYCLQQSEGESSEVVKLSVIWIVRQMIVTEEYRDHLVGRLTKVKLDW